MKAQYWLQILLAILTILGTALLGSGQQNMSLTLLMLVAAPAAVVCTDIYQWFRLSRTLANLAAIGSVVYAMMQFFSSGFENQLLSVANLLVYLQLILLFQEKSHRLNWQLLVLSLLEVVVSAAMNLNLRFFMVLLVYLSCTLIAMALLFILREASRFEVQGNERRRSPRIPEPQRGSIERLDAKLRRLLGGAPRVVSTTSSQAIVRELTESGYLRQVAWFGLVTLFFAVILFYSTPRLGSTNWQVGRSRGQATVGFSRQVSLDEMSDILQSDELALRISFFDHATNDPVKMVGEPYLRGAVLTRYSDTQGVGRWTISRSARGVSLDEAATVDGLVRQEVWLEPTSDPAVFGVFPLVRIPGIDTPLRYDRASGVVNREQPFSTMPTGRFRYVIGSYGFREGWQTAVTPLAERAASGELDDMADWLSFSQYSFPRIKKLAEDILAEANASDAGTLQKARILEQHFLQPGRYQYSLRFRQARNREMDPIEDFVANHRTGHCEYFATALVLMLRSQRIPARLVVGYHGGEYNALGNYYLVRQRDAHAWVEVLLNSEEIKEVGTASLPLTDASHGGWLRLDPTPGGGLPDEETQGVVWNKFDDFMEYAEFLWSDYVTGLNRERQRSSFYTPFWERMSQSVSRMFDPEQWREWSAATLSKLLRRWGIVNELGDFGWRMIVGVMVVFVMSILVARALVRIARGLARWCWRFLSKLAPWLPRRSRHAARRSVDFYERLERLLARKGVRRPEHQTPRELLSTAEQAAPIAEHRALWSKAAWQIVDAFYQVRFGGVVLDKTQRQQIDHALREVAAGLDGRSLATNQS